MKKQCFLDNHWLWEITIWIFFLQETCCFCFLNAKKAQEQTQIYDMWVSWRQFQKQQNWVKNWEFHFSDLCWMFFGCCWNQVTRHSLKPQNWLPKNHRKFGFIVLKEQWQVTCQTKHSQHKSWIFVFTFHNPQQQNKGQKDPRKDKDVTGGISTQIAKFSQSIILGKRKDSAWNSVRMSPNLSKNLSPFKWRWAWHLSRHAMTVVVESWLQLAWKKLKNC